MVINKKYCCTNPEGEDIYLFTLSNATGRQVCITNYGAIMTSFKIKMLDGSFNDIVIGFENVEDYLSKSYLKQYAYLGAACGRYANRIKNGRFSIDGKEYQVTQNMGNDQLHGGQEGFDKKVWQVINFNNAGLELKYLSKDGEEGFPGNLETTIRFSLNENNELSYEFSATTDKATAINLTHHSYFNLNNGEGTIEDHEIKIHSSAILVQDEGLVCNGEFKNVEGTIYDFRNFKKVNENWNRTNGYDQCFIIDYKKEELSLVAEARSLQSGVTLQIFSTDPAVQFYTGHGLGKLTGKNGIEYGPFSGLCLETHKHPNAVNIPNFPNTILRPGEIYKQQNVYKIIQSDFSK